MPLINPYYIFRQTLTCNSYNIFLFLLLTILTFSLIFMIINHNYPKNSNFGPKTYPIIGCLISFTRNQTRLLEWYTELLSEAPSQTIVVSRLGARRTIITANPANVEYILKTNFGNYPKGKPLGEILGDLLGNGIFNVDGELWANQRKLASHEFTTKSLKEFVFKILENEVEDRLIPLLEMVALQDKIIDLQEVLKRLTYDTICKLSLGIDPNCLDLTQPIPPLIKAFDIATSISAKRATYPIQLTWKLKRLLTVGSERRLKEAITTVHSTVNKIIDNKKNLKYKTPQDLLSRFLSVGNDGELARDIIVSFIMAGRDTTAAAMTWLLWLVSVVDTAARDEIRAELWSCSAGTRFDFESVKNNMKYLHACLCEAMRLYPPVAWDSKHPLNDDVLPDGTKVRKGDRVTYFPYGMGRMETIWGKNRFDFRPNRWFDRIVENNGGSSMKKISPYVFPIFQAGPRVCLGKELAFIQMKYVVASVIRRFDFEPVGSNQPVYIPLLTAHMAGGFKVRVIKRKS